MANEFLRDRISRKLANLPDERLYQVLDYIEFLDATAGYPPAEFFKQLGDLNADNPAVVDYLAGAYRRWIEQGAAAFRVDTLRRPHPDAAAGDEQGQRRGPDHAVHRPVRARLLVRRQ